MSERKALLKWLRSQPYNIALHTAGLTVVCYMKTVESDENPEYRNKLAEAVAHFAAVRNAN